VPDQRLSMLIASYSKTRSLPSAGHSWRIAFYPNRRLADTTAYVFVYLLLDDAGAGPVTDGGCVRMELTFTLHEVATGHRNSCPPW
jgi:hypothetical protein